MKKELILVGAGGLGREILTLVRALPEWRVIGFCDDAISTGTHVSEVPVLGGIDWLLQRSKPVYAVITIGSPGVKSKVVTALAQASVILYPTLLHPSVVLGDASAIQIGEGSIVTAGCIITTGITIGKHVLVNLNTTIGHDTTIGACSSVMPGVNLAGNVTLGREVLVGSGANIINQVKVGDRARVGAGAVVIHDVPPDTTVVGVPGRVVKEHA